MKFAVIIAIIILFSGSSCTKERTCECKNSISTYNAGTVDRTKSQAKKYCKSLSVGETVCELKK